MAETRPTATAATAKARRRTGPRSRAAVNGETTPAEPGRARSPGHGGPS